MRDALASIGTALLLVAFVVAPLLGAGLLLGASLALPAGLALGGLAVPVLLLHVLKPRAERRPVGSLLLWRTVAREQQAASPFKRLRRNLSLLLLLLALAALAVALARPVILSTSRDGAARVLVVDTSASMLAKDVAGGTRFAAALERARALVLALGPRDQATVIAADRTAWTVVPWTRDKGALRRGLDGLEARHVGTDLDEALVLAASAARGAPARPEVHLLSDGAAPPPEGAALGKVDVRYHAFGESADNVGLASIDLRPRAAAGEAGGAAGDAWEVFASVRNAGPAPRALLVVLERDGVAAAVRRVEAPVGRDLPVVLEARLPPGPVCVRLRAPDGREPDLFAVDDAAWAIVPAERGVPVGLVSTGQGPALRRALEAAGADVRLRPPGALQDDPAIRLWVFEGWTPPALPPRDALLVNPLAAIGPIRPGEPVARPRVAGWDREDPMLRWVELDDLQVERARRLELGGGARALVHSEAGVAAVGSPTPLLAAWQDGPALRVAVAFDLYESTWPLRASFPIFIKNLVALVAARDELARGALRAGDPLDVPVGAGEVEVEVVRPDGQVRRVRAQDGHAWFAGTDLVGVYEVRAGARRERFCVNLGAPEESRIAPRKEAVKLGDVEVKAEAAQAPRPTEVGYWLALVAMIALVVEAWAFHRRW